MSTSSTNAARYPNAVISDPKEALRMYFIGLYNISTMQKGIQALHAAVDYGRKFRDDEEFIRWADTHKTVILLDAGGTSEMDQVIRDLSTWKGGHMCLFQEPDLGLLVTSVAFIVPEKVYGIRVTPDLVRLASDPSAEVLNEVRFAVWLNQFNLAR